MLKINPLTNTSAKNINAQNNNSTPNTNVNFGANPNALRKVGKAFEFDKFNFSHYGLMAICYGAVILPRYFQSRDPDEKREVIVRDVITVTAIIFARRSLQNVFSKVCSNVTGFALHTKPKNHNGFYQKAYNYLRPHKGINILSSEQIASKYGNIHEYKNGIVDFCEFISKNDGDVKKVLSYDKNIKKNVIDLYKTWSSPNKNGNFDEATSRELVLMLKDKNKMGKDQNKYIKNIENILSNPNENSLVHHAKVLNSSFDFVTTFGLVPLMLGYFIPKFNENVTKKNRLKNKNSQDVITQATKAQ